MSSKLALSNAVSKFIDIEASVDDDDDEFQDSDNDSQADFVIGDESMDCSSSDKWLRWNDLLEEDDSPNFLTTLVQDLENRYTSSISPAKMAKAIDPFELDNPDVNSLIFLPAEDDLIFKVKVRAGLERDVVFSILQKSLVSPSTHAVLSAFCRDAIKGAIFIEAASMEAMQSTLHGLPGIARSSRRGGPYAIAVVDVQDRHLLLDMGFGGTRPVKANSWARLKYGTYRGDLALVTDVDPATLTCFLLLTPRINMERKRKRGYRPPQTPFDPQVIRATFGHNSVEKQNQYWCFKGDLYEAGCVRKVVHMTSLSAEGINASSNEFQPFYLCGEYWDKAAAQISPLKPGDKVRVVSGTFVGTAGDVLELLDMTVKLATHGDRQNTIEVLTRDVRKNFQIGDLVQVAHGASRGLEGFLVYIDETSASIFTVPLTDGGSVEKNGVELIVRVADIEWKSNVAVDAPAAMNKTPNVHTIYDPAHPRGLPYVPPDPSADLGRKVIDRYKHMEVLIVKGEAKCHLGIVKGTHKAQDGEILLDVQTYTKAINLMETYHVGDLRERFTKLPVDKAIWIPICFRNSSFFARTPPSASRSLTPLLSPGTTSGTDCGIMKEPTPKLDVPPPAVSTAGRWLLDSRLLLKKLDVRVQGTTSSHPYWQGGKFEGQMGWVILTNRVLSVEESTPVKTGFAENRVQLLIQHLIPEHTTEVPTYWPSSVAPVSILSAPGTRVVIVGPEFSGSTDYVGLYALVAQPPSPLPQGHGLVQIASTGLHWGEYIYIDIDSVCRSSAIPSPMNWFGRWVY